MITSSAEARRQRAAEEATEWAERLDSGSISKSDRTEFVEWLRESPVHVAEMLRHDRLKMALGELVDWSRVALSNPAYTSTVVPLALSPSQNAPKRRSRVRQITRYAAIAAGLALVVIIGLLGQRQLSATNITTRPGERREVTLQDGSVVRLSPGTDLRVELRPELRSIVLERGEAVFWVAKDSRRPFVVTANQTRIQAVGTVFTVARSTDRVVVTVTEGHVTVASSGASTEPGSGRESRRLIALLANDSITISAAGVPGAVHRAEAVRTTDLEDNKLIFENARVANVVAQFNRRNRVQIQISDDNLAARTVSGVFDANDPRSFVEFLTSVADVQNIDAGPGKIIVSRRSTGTGPSSEQR